MRLTPEEEAYTRDVAAQIGRDPDDLIREAEQIKAAGFREAQQHAEGWAQRSSAAGGLGMVASPHQDPCADPQIMAEDRAHRQRVRQGELEAEPG